MLSPKQKTHFEQIQIVIDQYNNTKTYYVKKY